MSFADVEDRVNASVFKKLANAVAAPQVGAAFGIVFDPAGSLVDGTGIVTQQPLFDAPVAGVAQLSAGMPLTITYRGAATAYTVRQVLPLDEGLRQRVILAQGA